MSKKVLLIVLGWEDRFTKGFEYDFENHGFDQCFLLCYKEYVDETLKSLNHIESFCLKNNISLTKSYLENSNALYNWKEIETITETLNEREIELLIDISTMPRETLWTVLFFLKKSFKKIPFIYHKPSTYSEDWLSREPESPRLLFKHSGIIKFERSTLLFILTGFDNERIKQLITFYDPKKIILLIQEGTQYNNAIRNNPKQLQELEHTNIEFHSSNSYDLLQCYNKIKEVLDFYIKDFNIVATSLGPKISGLALYKYFTENPSVALSYVPCKEYNIDYSKGWGGAISNLVEFVEPSE